MYTHGQTLEAWHDGREVRGDEGRRREPRYRDPRTRTKPAKIGVSMRMSRGGKIAKKKKKTNKKNEVGKIVRL